MIMNSNLREELTHLLADHLTLAESKRIIGGDKPATAWYRWLKVAEDAMEFIYGDEKAPEAVDPDHRSDHSGNAGSDSCSGGVAWVPRDDLLDDTGGVGPVIVEGNPDRLTLTGVFGPRELLTTRFLRIPSDDLLSLTEESDPVPVSDDERSVRLAPEPEREAE